MEVGDEGGYIHMLYCHHQNDSCIKMGRTILMFEDSVHRPRLLTRKES